MNSKREKKSEKKDSTVRFLSGIFSGRMPAVLVIAVAIILLEGCSSGEKHPDFLTAHNWLHYDGDNPEFKEYCLKEKLAEDAEFFEWNLQIVENSEGIYAEDSCEKLTEQEANEIIDGGSAIGFVWYNENAEITKIVLYGSTVHYE